MTDTELLKIFKLKFAPLQAIVAGTVVLKTDADAQSYFEDVYEPEPIVPQEETLASLLALWGRHDFKELLALEPELGKISRELRMQNVSDQKVSDFLYAMY